MPWGEETNFSRGTASPAMAFRRTIPHAGVEVDRAGPVKHELDKGRGLDDAGWKTGHQADSDENERAVSSLRIERMFKICCHAIFSGARIPP